MKVVLLGPYPVDPAAPAGRPPLPGGVDAVVLALARGLARCGDVEVSVITALPGLAEPVCVAGDGFPVYCVPRPRGGRLTGQRAVVAGLRAQLAALAPDIVHAHIAGIYARAALEVGLPAVITLHGIIRREMQQAWPVTRWPTRLRWLSDALFEERVVHAAREIIAISPYILTEFRGRTRARFHLIENPVADRFFVAPEGLEATADRGDLRGLAEGERVLCVARIIPRKGILPLIEAFAVVAAARPAATLTLVGEMTSEPAYATACRAAAASLGIGTRVSFAGGLPPEQVQAHYAAADVVALASAQETAPVSIAEAMAAGRAVVTTDTGGCGAMVTHGVTGLVVPLRDRDALAGALAALLADPPRRIAMGQAGRAAAESRFRLASIVEATLGVYRQVIESGNPSTGDMTRTASPRPPAQDAPSTGDMARTASLRPPAQDAPSTGDMARTASLRPPAQDAPSTERGMG